MWTLSNLGKFLNEVVGIFHHWATSFGVKFFHFLQIFKNNICLIAPSKLFFQIYFETILSISLFHNRTAIRAITGFVQFFKYCFI
jgi:hypothetical protein